MKRVLLLLVLCVVLACLWLVPVHANIFVVGKVTVSSAGTPVQAQANTGTFNPTGVVTVQYPALKESGSANTGQLYVGTSNLNKTGRVGVACVLNPGGTCSFGSNNKWAQPSEVWMDADTSGAETQVSVVY